MCRQCNSFCSDETSLPRQAIKQLMMISNKICGPAEPHQEFVDLKSKEMVERMQKGRLPAWRIASVVTYRQPQTSPDAFRSKGSPSHGAPAPFHARYSHYKKYGFSGSSKIGLHEGLSFSYSCNSLILHDSITTMSCRARCQDKLGKKPKVCRTAWLKQFVIPCCCSGNWVEQPSSIELNNSVGWSRSNGC